MYKKIQESDFIDIFRIVDGTLLYVQKHKRVQYYSNYFYGEEFNKSSKFVRGCKGLRQLKIDYKYYNFSKGKYEIIPAGTFLLNGHVVETITKENFTFEIKSNEGFGGTKGQMNEIFYKVNEIMESYN